jgi:prefoldin subunit 5
MAPPANSGTATISSLGSEYGVEKYLDEAITRLKRIDTAKNRERVLIYQSV